MPSYSERRSLVKEFKEICSGASDSVAQKVLESNNWDVNQAVNYFFNNRWKYPELKQGNKNKIKKIFAEYADKEDPKVMSESGMIQFFKDVGVNPEGHETLAIAWLLKGTEMGLFQQAEFIDGFVKAGCSSKGDIKKSCLQVVKSLSDEKQFVAFYKWLFHHAKEDEKKRSISTELAVALWKIVLAPKKKYLNLLDGWIDYCEEQFESEQMMVVSKDVWEQVYDFLLETKNLDSFDESGAWPVAIDEFVEWAKEKKSQNK